MRVPFPPGSPPRRDWSPLRASVSSPGRGRLLGSEFDSTPRLRHFPGEPRRSAKSVRMIETGFVVLNKPMDVSLTDLVGAQDARRPDHAVPAVSGLVAGEPGGFPVELIEQFGQQERGRHLVHRLPAHRCRARWLARELAGHDCRPAALASSCRMPVRALPSGKPGSADQVGTCPVERRPSALRPAASAVASPESVPGRCDMAAGILVPYERGRGQAWAVPRRPAIAALLGLAVASCGGHPAPEASAPPTVSLTVKAWRRAGLPAPGRRLVRPVGLGRQVALGDPGRAITHQDRGAPGPGRARQPGRDQEQGGRPGLSDQRSAISAAASPTRPTWSRPS